MIPSQSAATDIRLGKISYRNAAPVYFGLEHRIVPGNFTITSAPPAVLNLMLARGELDISPVSSAAYSQNHRDWMILPRLSIACDGPVMSVILASNMPLNRLSGKRVLLTEESAAAAGLLKIILCEDGITPCFVTQKIEKPSDIDRSAAAALIIGDTALRFDWSNRFEQVFDLGELWKQRTGLPFVFAVWAVRKTFAVKYPQLTSAMLEQLRLSYRIGQRNLGTIATQTSRQLGLDLNTARAYFEKLHYDLEPDKIKGLTAYFQRLMIFQQLAEPAKPEFFSAAEIELTHCAA